MKHLGRHEVTRDRVRVRRSAVDPRRGPGACGGRRQRHRVLPLRRISDQVHRGAFASMIPLKHIVICLIEITGR
jgi:hypothetical protein